MGRKISKIRRITNLEEAILLCKDDPVRPNIDPQWRITPLKEMYTIDKKAVVCVSFTNSLPISEMDLVGRIHTGNIAIFYTVWSKEKGLGRLALNETLNIISKRATIKRFITLSPKTEIAKRFHLSNGATLLQENFDTNNFEYKV